MASNRARGRRVYAFSYDIMQTFINIVYRIDGGDADDGSALLAVGCFIHRARAPVHSPLYVLHARNDVKYAINMHTFCPGEKFFSAHLRVFRRSLRRSRPSGVI